MPTSVIMPKFEMSQETGTVARWLKQEGDAVEKGEAILEVETDKVTMEVESPAKGVLREIAAQPGDVVPIGQVIAQVETTADRRPQTAAETTANRKPQTAVPPATPIAVKIAAEAGIDLTTIRGTGKGGLITREDVERSTADRRLPTAAGSMAEELSAVSGRRAPLERSEGSAVPAARRLARELGVDLRDVRGSGPGGRIQSGDVEKSTADRRPPTAVETAAVDSAAVGGRRSAVDSAVILPLTPIRRTIAQRMLASVNEIPQFNLSVDVNMARAQAVVEDFKQLPGAANAPKVTLTAFLIKACAWALARHPAVNASYTPDGIIRYTDVNVGIAVALDDGLVVPVIQRASTLDLPAIAVQLSDLATRARAGKLTPADMQGGTFSISNLGMFAVDRFTAIVNPPQAAILAVGRTTKRFVPDANDQPVAAPMSTFTVSADHRAVDGAQIGRFLGDLQQAVERPGVML